MTNTIETGCIFDGHNGQYIYGYIVDLACSYGYKPSAEYNDERDRLSLERFGYVTPHHSPEATEVVIEEANDAEQYLNDKVAAPNHSFGWHDGEYFYMPDAWWHND